MKLVIELDDETYNDTIDRPRLNLIGLLRLIEAVQKGTPLEEALENQKTGHWIRWYEEVEHKTCTENIPHCKCSECNKEYNPYSSFFIKYCSQCGAKMEGE